MTLFIAETSYAQKYPIRLSSPDHVGQKNWISLSGSRHQEVSVSQNGQLIKSQMTNMLVIFEGREEILTLDGKGLPVRESFTVEKFAKTEDGISTVLLKPGSMILTDGGQEETKQIVLKGGVLDEDSRDAFAMLMPPHTPDSLSDDDIYGTKEPRGVGDSWTINKAAAVADLKDVMIIPVERMTGTSSIVSRDNFGGDECLNMLTEVKADGVSLKNGPAGFGAGQGTLQMVFRGCIPIRSGVISRKESGEVSTQYRLKGMPGSPAAGVTMDMTLNQKVDMVVLPPKP